MSAVRGGSELRKRSDGDVRRKGAAVEEFLRVGLGNAVAAGGLALGAILVGVFARRRPALRRGLWLLVLLKLITPPIWTIPVTTVAELIEAALQQTPPTRVDLVFEADAAASEAGEFPE